MFLEKFSLNRRRRRRRRRRTWHARIGN